MFCIWHYAPQFSGADQISEAEYMNTNKHVRIQRIRDRNKNMHYLEYRGRIYDVTVSICSLPRKLLATMDDSAEFRQAGG